MSRYIDVEFYCNNLCHCNSEYCDKPSCPILKAPTADVEEVRHGKWISASKKQGVNCGMKCSECGARIKYSEFFNGNHNYCHKCGAKMDGKGGEG